jgi:hypothetical protein
MIPSPLQGFMSKGEPRRRRRPAFLRPSRSGAVERLVRDRRRNMSRAIAFDAHQYLAYARARIACGCSSKSGEVEDDELAAIRIESTHTIDIDAFVPRAEVDERYLDTPYYLAPADRVAQEAFAIIRAAMRKKGVVGLARVVPQKRERILKLEPLGKGLLATTLRYASQVRDERAAFEDIADLTLQDEFARSRRSHHRDEDWHLRSEPVCGSL